MFKYSKLQNKYLYSQILNKFSTLKKEIKFAVILSGNGVYDGSK